MIGGEQAKPQEVTMGQPYSNPNDQYQQQYQQQMMMQQPGGQMMMQQPGGGQMMMMQPQVMVAMQPMGMAVNQDEARTLHIQPRILQYQSKMSCWKTVSMVFLCLTILNAIVQFINRNPAGGAGGLVGILVWVFWYKSCDEGYKACVTKQWGSLNEAIKYINWSMIFQYIYMAVYVVILIIFIIVLANIENDDSLDEDEKDFWQFIILYLIIIPTIIVLLVFVCFICTARGQRDMAQNIVQELRTVGAINF